MDDELFKKRKQLVDELIHDKAYVPMKAKEIAVLMGVGKDDRQMLQDILDGLVFEGRCILSAKGKYCLPSKNEVVGVYSPTANGYGFVIVDGEEDDIFVHERDSLDAMYGDSVQVHITDEAVKGRRREGIIVRIIKRGYTEIVGTFDKDMKGDYGFVIPDNTRFIRDIYIPKGATAGAVAGHKVVAHITDYGDDRHNPEGEIVKIIGHKDDPGTDILSIAEAFALPGEFPDEVKAQLSLVPDEVTNADIGGRHDFRKLLTVTIDGEDAKDLDDAITIEKKGDNYRLGVHIADVTNYVTENSALDKEACKRGTSVYLVDRVIPMLPHQLSNGICSLNQGVDRLALSCMMTIDPKGNIIDHEICESVINVDKRMSYTGVKRVIVDNEPAAIEEFEGFVDMFRLMDELAGILRAKRHARGSIDFDFPESKITLDDKGIPTSVAPYERTAANKLIEDFMLAANETVAEEYFWSQLPFVYRVHDNPDPEKIRQLGTFINNFGYSIKISNEEVHPKELQKLLEKIDGSDEEALIVRLTLRSMKRAQYSTDCTGHFGLAAKYYTHFTSPIRRYPDLQIHRIIKENIRSGISDKRIKHYEAILPGVAKNASTTERRADDAERECDKLKKAQYMSMHIGEVFEGVISGVTAWGMYVELPSTVEGLVSIKSLKGRFEFSARTYELIGTGGKSYKLGEHIKVKCTGADTMLKTIDFEVYDGREE